MLTFFATCPKDVEALLSQELGNLGANVNKQTVAGVYFTANLLTAYRICLWSRLANRILLVLANKQVKTVQALYESVREINWAEHIKPTGTLLVHFTGQSESIKNTHFGALKVKDAIVDQLRDNTGIRPSISKESPSLRVHVNLRRETASIAIDLSGESLHKRGYRSQTVIAPLKENLAAAILLRANWPKIVEQQGTLIDPLCGSGTLLIEAAMIAADIAPGLLRRNFGFQTWPNYKEQDWQLLLQEARTRRDNGSAKSLPEIRGYDADPRAISAAHQNIMKAGLEKFIDVKVRELSQLKKPTHKEQQPGLIIANAPYGERLNDITTLAYLYKHLAIRLKEEFLGWQAALFTGNPDLGKKMGLRSNKQYSFYNGAIPCKLLLFTVDPIWFVQEKTQNKENSSNQSLSAQLSSGAEMFANRLAKNKKHLAKWARKNAIFCYRIYDADMPEYAMAIDCYQDWIHVQEYTPPASIDPAKAEQRLQEAVSVIPKILEIPSDHVVVKQRRKQKGLSQYEKYNERKKFIEITEGSCKFLVNLTDYIDTGLFLDSRPIRQIIYNTAKKCRFLNLFCYTATATVYAALGGAKNSTSVDLSKTYLDWARRNFALNGLSESLHRVVQADCMQWLDNNREQYDLILLEPPTFSNSKRMENTLDVQRDHANLIRKTIKHLTPQGLLIFSTNYRRFKLDEASLNDLAITNISSSTIDKDFERDQKIHQCWKIKYKI